MFKRGTLKGRKESENSFAGKSGVAFLKEVEEGSFKGKVQSVCMCEWGGGSFSLKERAKCLVTARCGCQE